MWKANWNRYVMIKSILFIHKCLVEVIKSWRTRKTNKLCIQVWKFAGQGLLRGCATCVSGRTTWWWTKNNSLVDVLRGWGVSVSLVPLKFARSPFEGKGKGKSQSSLGLPRMRLSLKELRQALEVDLIKTSANKNGTVQCHYKGCQGSSNWKPISGMFC